MVRSGPTSRSARRLITPKHAGVALGLVIMGYGLSLATEFPLDSLISMFKWSVGIAVFHDMVWLPLTVAVWHLLQRLPRWLRAPLGSGLALSVALTLVFLPFLLGYGERDAIPSLLPRNYTTGLFAYLGVVWLMCGLASAIGWWRSRSAPAL